MFSDTVKTKNGIHKHKTKKKKHTKTLPNHGRKLTRGNNKNKQKKDLKNGCGITWGIITFFILFDS